MASSPLSELSSRLGLSNDEARRLVAQFVQQLHEDIAHQGLAVIPGLGTFSGSSGALSFTPDEDLASAINHRFVNLDPVVVAVDVPPSDGADTMLEEQPVPVVPDVEEALPDPGLQAPRPADDADQVDFESRLEQLIAGMASPAEAAVEADKDESEPPPARETGEPAVAAAMLPDEPTQGHRGVALPRALIATLAVVGVLLLVAVAFVMSRRNAPEAETPAVASRSAAPVAVDSAMRSPGPDTSGLAVAPPDSQAVPTAAPQPVEQPALSGDPLRSRDGIVRSAGGWTLVVGSAPTRAGAEQQAAEWREQGYRTSVVYGERQGKLRYRVAVGQWTTDAGASAARRELADTLPPDAWPMPIQPEFEVF